MLVRPWLPSIPYCNVLGQPLTIAHSSCEDSFSAIRLFARLTIFARMADVLDGLEPGTLADLVCLDVFAYFDDYSSSFVACTFCSHLSHLGQVPVVEHEMDIAEAKTGGIELDQDIVGPCPRKMLEM